MCQFRKEIEETLAYDLSQLILKFGNVRDEDEFTTEYCVKGIPELLKMPDVVWSKLHHLPF